MDAACVILCSVPIEPSRDASAEDKLLFREGLAQLKKDFAQFIPTAELYGRFPLMTFADRTQDGGNGGGGDGSHALTFIVGDRNAGTFNFRFCPALPSDTIRSVVNDNPRPPTPAELEDHFPSAARIELCSYESNISTAKTWLASRDKQTGGFYLSRLFKYVMLVPITPKRAAIEPGNGVAFVNFDV